MTGEAPDPIGREHFVVLARQWAVRAGESMGTPSAADCAAIAQVYATLALVHAGD